MAKAWGTAPTSTVFTQREQQVNLRQWSSSSATDSEESDPFPKLRLQGRWKQWDWHTRVNTWTFGLEWVWSWWWWDKEEEDDETDEAECHEPTADPAHNIHSLSCIQCIFPKIGYLPSMPSSTLSQISPMMPWDTVLMHSNALQQHVRVRVGALIIELSGASLIPRIRSQWATSNIMQMMQLDVGESKLYVRT